MPRKKKEETVPWILPEKEADNQIPVEPIGDRVVVRLDPVEVKSPGGIVLPEQSKGKSTFGTVVAKGPGAHRHADTSWRYPMQVKVGDRVALPEFAADSLPLPGEDSLVIIREDAVLAILRN